MENIEIGKIYNYFDDGKIRESRKRPVLINKIIPFNEINEDVLKDWEDDVEECDWLYAKETDYFIEGILDISDDCKKTIYFVRTLNDGWFSLGWWAGRLDEDGKLTKLLENNFNIEK